MECEGDGGSRRSGISMDFWLRAISSKVVMVQGEILSIVPEPECALLPFEVLCESY